MNTVFKNWDATRIFRLVLALGALIYGIVAKDYLFLPLGIWFMLMAVLNFSCCGSGSCASSGGSKQVYKGIIKPYKK